MPKTNSQTGRTLMEILFVVSVLGIVSSGIYATAARVTGKRIEMETIVQAQNIIDDARTKFSWSRSYKTQDGTTLAKVLYDSKIIRQYAPDDDSTLNKSGLKVFLYPSETDLKAFIMEVNNVPSSLCVQYLSNAWPGLIEWSVSLTEANADTWETKYLPLVNSEAISNCKGSSTKTVKLKFN